jgi:hypothetical protein
MKFSERLKIRPVKSTIQTNSIDEDLRNSLWTVIHETLLSLGDNPYISGTIKFTPTCRSIWIDFFKLPIDTLVPFSDLNVSHKYFTDFLRIWFFKASWYEVYDFIDYLGKLNIPNFIKSCNLFLERELSAFRFVDFQLVSCQSLIDG